MQARRLSAARGAFWLFEGFRLFRRNPPLITALTLVYLLIVQLLAALLPGIGPVVLPLLLPVMTLIVANGCRGAAGRTQPPGVADAIALHTVDGNGAPLQRQRLDPRINLASDAAQPKQSNSYLAHSRIVPL